MAIRPGNGPSLEYIDESSYIFLETFSDPRIEGFADWEEQKRIMKDRAKIIAFQPWGTIHDLYSDYLYDELIEGNKNISYNSPDLGLKFLDQLIDDDYEFYEFWDW